MTDIKESILYQELSAYRRRVVDICAEYLQDLWSEHRLIAFYTDHGYNHSVRILARIEELLNLDSAGISANPLSDDEKFLLTLSVIFHDIGMQCDLSKHHYIKAIVKSEYGVEFRSVFSGRYTQENMIEQRKYHHLISAAWLLNSRRLNDGMLGRATAGISDTELNCIRDICRYHSKLVIYDCPEMHNPTRRPIRKRFLAALLRIGDELDIGEERVVSSTPDDFFMPDEDSFYWFLHSRTIVAIENSIIAVKICISANDYYYYRHNFQEHLKMLFRKNTDLLDVLWRQGLHLCFDRPEDCVIELKEKLDIPKHCLDILFSTKSQKLQEPDESTDAKMIQGVIDTAFGINGINNINQSKTLEEMMEWDFNSTL